MPISADLQKLIDDFGKQSGVSADAVTNLTATINGSPALLAQLNDVVSKGHLKAFGALTDPHAGGAYRSSDQTMLLPIKGLEKAPGGTYDAGNMTFVLGHEVQHGYFRGDRATALATFATEATAMAKSPAAVHDYTTIVGKMIQTNRDDEAKAHIAGWNALVGNVRQAKPTATLEDVYLKSPGRAGDFINRSGTAPNFTYAMKPDLTVGADLSMAQSADNIKAMGKYYFDMPGSQARLGHNGNSDYANYYGASYVSFISQLEHAHGKTADGNKPAVHLNMTQLKLNESLMEQNGIDLGANSAGRQPYVDISTSTPKPGNFDHTKTTHRAVPINSPLEALLQDDHSHIRVDPRSSEHADHKLFSGIRDKVEGEFARHGRSMSEGDLDRIAAGMTLEGKRNGITSPDHVALSVDPVTREVGKTAFLVQGGLNDPAHVRVGVPTDKAPPAEESFRQIDALNQSQTPAQPTPPKEQRQAQSM